jgi:hypothetical protein
MRHPKPIFGVLICFLALGRLCLLPSKATFGPQCEIINFDDVDAEHDDVAAEKYLLRKCGIKVSDLTPGTQLVIVSDQRVYDGRSLRASSGHNMLTQGNSGDPISFTLNFPEPVRIVRFTRPKLLAGETGITFPEWSAQALDANGQSIGPPVGEPLGSGPVYYHDVPPKTFALKGPAIQAVRFQSNNRHFAAFSAVIIDDLTLEKESKP